MRTLIFTVAFVALLCIGAFSSCRASVGDTELILPVAITDQSIYALHAPIRINSDAEFNVTFSNRTIFGLDINGTAAGCCIYIGNCSLPFAVKNNNLHNASGEEGKYYEESGICLFNSTNGTVISNICTGNTVGIFLEESRIISVTGNTCRDNGGTVSGAGIKTEYSNDNRIENNNCSANPFMGIDLHNSDNLTALNNSCSLTYCGIRLFGGDLNLIQGNLLYDSADRGVSGEPICGIDFHPGVSNSVRNNRMFGCGLVWSLSPSLYFELINNTITPDNLVNGKPIMFYKNLTGGTIPSGAGEVILLNCQNVTVENQNISNGTVGMQIAGSKWCKVKSNSFLSNWGPAILAQNCENTTFSENTCKAKGEFGLRMQQSAYNVINENTISGSSNSGIGLEYSQYNSVLDNTLYENYWGIYLGITYNNTIARNHIYNNSGDGIHISSFSDTFGWNTITDNTLVNNTDAISLHSACGNEITGNNATGNRGNGIYLSDSRYNAIISNDASNNANGIYLSKSWENTVISNNGSDCLTGVRLDQSSTNLVQNNTVVCDTNGIDITVESNMNTIVGNTVSSHNMSGIRITSNSDGNLITYNTIFDCGEHGLRISMSSMNRIYLNNFINNCNQGRQARDDSIENFWNSSAQGNFWSDWSSPDNDTDGIVDIHYYLEGEAVDYLPLATETTPPPVGEPPSIVVVLLLVILPIIILTRKVKG